jgi:DNA-binding MarR family transcriptional regulator
VETTLQLLCTIRSELRAESAIDLTMAQFRTLTRLRHQAGSGLSDLADDIGVSPPAVSKLIDGLVERGLVLRTVQEDDRRRVGLAVSPAGLRALDKVRAAVQGRVAGRLAGLSAGERTTLHDALGRVGQALAEKEVMA